MRELGGSTSRSSSVIECQALFEVEHSRLLPSVDQSMARNGQENAACEDGPIQMQTSKRLSKKKETRATKEAEREQATKASIDRYCQEEIRRHRRKKESLRLK